MTLEIAEVVRVAQARVIASLARTLGDLSLAEDAVQDAVVSAVEVWPKIGVPDNPVAWLTVAARRKAIDVVRREQSRVAKESEGIALSMVGSSRPEDSVIDDDLLRLVFVCCHPSIALEARVALALRVLGGLSVEEIAKLFLVSPSTMAKRLVRTRRKILVANIPFKIPDSADLPERVSAVVAVLHLVYTSGHAGSGSDNLRIDLCDEAIRLARLLLGLLPEDATVEALLSLMLTTNARRPTRFDANGQVILLADQDRSKWNQAEIAQGLALLDVSVARTGGRADSYQLQAAISASHATAPTAATVDWPEIARLYELLEEVNPGPVVRMNRAVAVAEVEGPEAGLVLLEGLEAKTFRLSAVRAELQARSGLVTEARKCFESAIEQGTTGEASDAEIQHLEKRLAELA